uniref:TAZ-type domain-containing protein n=1 Tax=Peronospora matthiolae TaxID=2874970 RepID=A0AAV1V6D3_9STRA
MDEFCSWCKSRRWSYRCGTCDPGTEKTLCANCSTLWHSRGIARSHQLTTSDGRTQSFSAWTTSSPHDVDTRNGSAEAEARADEGVARGLNGDRAQEASVGYADDVEVAVAGGEVAVENATIAMESVVEGTDVDNCVEENEECDMASGAERSREDGDDASKERMEFEEKVAIAAAAEVVREVNIDLELKETMETTDQNGQELMESRGYDAETDPVVPTTLAAPALSPAPPSTLVVDTDDVHEAARPILDEDPSTLAAATPVNSPETMLKPPEYIRTVAPATSPTSERILNSASATLQLKPVDLEKLLRWFPTTDRVLTEMLATHIEKALRIEDALICARIGKCEEKSCRSVLLHYEHCKTDVSCGDPKCAELATVYRHCCACGMRGTGSLSFVCPFCIRICQRRSMGVSSALDYLINDQRRALQSVHSEASRSFRLQSIDAWQERKRTLRVETDRLNQLASESSAPIYNFPRYQWHFNDTAFIKRELMPVKTQAKVPAFDMQAASLSESAATELPSSAPAEGGNYCESGIAGIRQNPGGIQDAGHVNTGADSISALLRAKSKDGEGREVSQREFDKITEQGYAIVDASFCVPSNAQRCLLNCKSILAHLQHHFNLQVCSHPLCAKVKHHFAHLSQCKARGEIESCEYCLRVEERRLVRSVNRMEAEQHKAEAMVQRIIGDLTSSFTNDRPDRREQETIQLEGELDQAVASKQKLLDNLRATSADLRKTRRSMERHGVLPGASHHLPVHFGGTRSARTSDDSFKKRRLIDSLDLKPAATGSVRKNDQH